MGPEDVADRRTGFVIGFLVGQVIGCAECFAAPAVSNSSGNMHLPRDHVLPDTVEGLDVIGVARKRRNVGGAAVEVGGHDAMADSAVLLEQRRVVLFGWSQQIAARRPAPAHIYKELGQVEGTLFAGLAIEFAQANFYFRVAGNLDLCIRTKNCVDKLEILKRDIEQGTFARCLIVSDGRFVEMAYII
jgi:hypothetical protein